MAVDEVLWRWSAETGQCCWRFYRWQQPTLSLGYFQAYEDRLRHPASRDCPVVRRMSGGGAILHDAELTYSFTLPSRHRLAARRLALYRAVHTALIDVLGDLGLAASLCGEADSPTSRQKPFLCFQRRSPGDLIMGQVKIAGSAQRRSRGAVLQHGSVLLARSPAAPELDALEDLATSSPNENRIVEAWLEKLARRLALCWKDESLDDDMRRQAFELMQAKYATQAWTANRNR